MQIHWYEALSPDSVGLLMGLFFIFSLLVFVFSKKLVSKCLLFVGAFAYIVLASYLDGSTNVEEIQALNLKLSSFEELADKNGLTYREDLKQLLNEIEHAQKPGYHYIGDIFRLPNTDDLSSESYLSENQFAIYMRFINHCYDSEMIANILSERLEGYPVLPEEAQKALEYAEAHSDDTKPECLGSVATLSFLR